MKVVSLIPRNCLTLHIATFMNRNVNIILRKRFDKVTMVSLLGVEKPQIPVAEVS